MILSSVQLGSFRHIRDALINYAFGNTANRGNWLDPEIIDSFVATNPADLDTTELALVSRWRDSAPGPFFVMRHTPSCSIFMNELGTFAVRGTAHELAELVSETPTLVDVTLVPFGNHIVCASDPRFDKACAGHANRADIDATYRGLSDKSVIYSAAIMTRTVRAARKARSTTESSVARARVGRMAASARSVEEFSRASRPTSHRASARSAQHSTAAPRTTTLAPGPQLLVASDQTTQVQAPQTVAGKLAAALSEFESMPVVPMELLAPLSNPTPLPSQDSTRRSAFGPQPAAPIAFA